MEDEVWHCKYQIRVDDNSIPAIHNSNEDYWGYIYLHIEPLAFDTYIFIILQPISKFKDLSECNPQNYITAVELANFYYKYFYIPAEYDVFIYFTPYSNSDASPWDQSNEGKFTA